MASWSARIIFCLLVGAALWLGVNIVRVASGDGLIPAGPLDGRGKPVRSAASAGSGVANGSAEPQTTASMSADRAMRSTDAKTTAWRSDQQIM